ncbi:hypothetical protein HPB49_005791 [Dermacentor silvarum]|uniref:Uncharacterized protein n=1 Tax=Dermacentor silvarum TaxID=543639 RepID=A0ACB8DB55_DERSI|nr:hypothetical protein HPB49_005791 [Dermacentor silvarum]
MRCRHPELAGGALIDGCDVLALQETYVRAGELNLPGFVAYHSATSCQQASCTASPCVDPSHPAGRSRASLYVRAGLAQAEVNVCDLPCANVECVAVTVRVGATDTCVASVYVRSGRRWDTEFVCRLSDRVGGDLVVCGDFNSHHTAWGSNHIDCSGRGLLDSVLRAGLLIANTGAVTFVRSGCAGSAIDLTLVSDRCHYAWRRNPDTGGSDHFPIFLVPRATADLPTRSYSVVNWPRFRELCAAVPVSECGLFRHIAECARAATTRCVVPAGTPVPDIKQLNLRAARRRAQRKAVRTDKREHWTVYNRLDAVCRRHARQRRSASWSSLCCSLDDPRARSRPWRILGAVLRPRVPRCPALSIAVARGITNAQLAELLAATFCPPTAASTRPTGILQPHHHPRRELMAPQRYFPAAGTLEEISALCTADFTIGELRTVLASRRRRSAPGSDGVTYQMLRNFDSDQLHHLLDAYNAVWRSGVIPREWSEAVVVPLLKNGKPPRDPASYRPVSLTSAAGKVLEAMALRRLEWIAAVLDILAAEQSGFRRLRASADSLADVVTTLEEAKHRGDASYLVLLDVMSAFDQLPHATILDALCAMGVSGRLLAYVGAFLSGRTMRVRVGGALSQPRAVSTGVPQGSVLSPFLFNLALARIGDYIPQLPEYEVRVAVYADDIALFASGPTARGSVVRGCVQSALDAVDEYVRGIGLTLSAAKTEAMLLRALPMRRGMQVAISAGVLSAYTLAGFAWEQQAAGCAMASMPMLALQRYVIENPRWLMSKGLILNADTAVMRLYGVDPPADFRQRKAEGVQEQQMGPTSYRLWPTHARMVSACLLLHLLQNISGAQLCLLRAIQVMGNAVAEISPQLLAAMLVAAHLGCASLAAAFTKAANRRTLLAASAFLAASVLIIFRPLEHLAFTHWSVREESSPTSWGAVISVGLLVLAYSVGLCHLPALLTGEIMPSRIRLLGSSVVWSSRWLVAFLLMHFDVDVLGAFQQRGPLLALSLTMVVVATTATLLIPETEGRTLTQINTGS